MPHQGETDIALPTISREGARERLAYHPLSTGLFRPPRTASITIGGLSSVTPGRVARPSLPSVAGRQAGQVTEPATATAAPERHRRVQQRQPASLLRVRRVHVFSASRWPVREYDRESEVASR